MEVWHALSAVVAGLAVGLIGTALARLPRTPIAPPVYAFVGAGVLWAVGDLIADTATNMAWKRTGVEILYTGSIAMPACWWAIALRWSEEVGAGLPMRSPLWIRVPFAFAALMWVAMITNPWHEAFLTPVLGGRNIYEPLWYAMAAPNYALIVAAFVVELAVVARVARRDVRHQGAFMIAASLLTLLGNWAYVSETFEVNLTQAVLGISATLLVVGMAREGLFGVLPTALRDFAADHPDGLIVVDPEGYVRFSNARAQALLAPIEITGGVPLSKTLRDARLRTETPVPLDSIGGDPCAGLDRPGGALFRLDAGRARWLHIRATPVRGNLGRRKGHGVRVTDLTAHREAELQARRTHRLDSTADLARTISREFQGAFALVQNNAELLQTSVGPEAAMQRQLSRIVDAARLGSDLALQLQLYTGSVDTTRVVLDLGDVARESCELIEADLPPDVRLVVERPPELLPVWVDAIQVRHCVYEILTNAVEAMAESPGEIRVWTGVCKLDPNETKLVWGADQPAAEYATLRVCDAGGGMSPQTEERAFEPFFSTRGKDRGVGLPTVLGIARAHGAPVALDNTVGEGCELTVYFPVEHDA